MIRTPCIGRLAAAIVLLVAGAPAPRAEEPPVKLAPIGPSDREQRVDRAAGSGGRIDPMRPARLSSGEREQLYEQVSRDAELLERQGSQLRRLTKLLRPAVVHIDAKKPAARPKNGKSSEEEAGSGVIGLVSGRTVVITNRHVVNRAELDNITIRLDDGRELRPTRLWSDPGTDIAVMEIEGEDLETARFAAADSLQIGDTVPVSTSCRVTNITIETGIAKPMPSLPPELLAMAVLRPTTSPRRLTSGPPLLPGLMAASVWMKS